MKAYKKIITNRIETEFEKADNHFIGESIEEKVRRVTADNTTIEATSSDFLHQCRIRYLSH